MDGGSMPTRKNWPLRLYAGYTFPARAAMDDGRMEGMKSKDLDVMKVLYLGIFALLVFALPSPAQGPGDNLKAFLDLGAPQLRAKTQEIISGSMNFTEAEGKVFWPLYKEYDREWGAITDRSIALIKDYQANVKNLSDAKAKELAEKVFEISEQKDALNRKYYGKFIEVLSPRRVFQFFQLSHRIDTLVNLKIASILPMIGEDW